MKKIAMIMNLIFSLLSAYAKTNNYEYEYIRTYDQSFIIDPSETYGIVGITFQENRKLVYNSNSLNFLFLNNDFSIRNNITVNNDLYIPIQSWKMFYSNNYLFFQGAKVDSSIIVFDDDDKILNNFIVNNDKYECVFIKDDFVILESDDGYKSIIIPDDFNEDLIHLNQDETFTFIKENWTSKDQFWIDKDRYILFGERLITGNGNVFKNYFNFENNINALFVSVDKYNNYYWGRSRSIFIFNKKGSLIKSIKADAKYPMSPVSIDPDGNVYYFHYNEETYNTDLYRIKNDWSTITPDPYEAVNKTGTVTEFRVRIRDNPSLYGKHIGLLTKNDRIEILSRTTEKMAIDDMNDYWYRIKRPDGTEGWIYGYFIKIEE